MAIENFIPEIWNSQLLLDFQEQAVAANLVNRQYEGDARRGNTVKITTATRVTVSDYKADGRTTAPSAVSDEGIDLLIDQGKSFDFYIDDIDRAQSAGSLEAYTRSASEALAEDADKFILSELYDADADPMGGAVSDGEGAWNVIRDLRKDLNKASVPKGQRVLFINAEFEALLLSADPKPTHVGASGSHAGQRESAVGNLLVFRVVITDNPPCIDEHIAMALYQPAYA